MEKNGAKVQWVMCLCLTLAGSHDCFAGGKKGQSDWIPAEAYAGKIKGYQGVHRIQPVVYTKIPKPTAEIEKYEKKYVFDLKKFNIYSDGTHPVETSKGINAALQHAKKVKANRIIFPKGTYLISEKDPVIFNHANTVVDLNGSTLQINPNGLLSYGIVRIEYGCDGFRLTNGTLRGDKDTHDYKTVKGSHEWGCGLVFISGREMEIDHLTVTNVTGYGVATGTGLKDRRKYGGYYNLMTKNLEHGGFSKKGTKVEDTNKIRTVRPYDMSHFGGEFEIGFIYQYMCFPAIKDRNYQAYFFSSDMKRIPSEEKPHPKEGTPMQFVARKEYVQFKKNAIPKGARYMHLEFNQAQIENAKQEKFAVCICNLRPPVDVHFHDNRMVGNRALGMAYCGGQRWILENNLFLDNGGVAPGFGIDFEDGWDLMQDVVFRKNKFKGNQRGDLITCAGSEMIFEDNEFEKHAGTWGRTHNFTFRRNKFMGGAGFRSRTGLATIEDNHFEKNLGIWYEHADVDDGIYTPGDAPVATPAVVIKNSTLNNIRIVKGTYFKLVDCTVKNTKFRVSKDTSLVHLKNTSTSDSSIHYDGQGPSVNVYMENCEGTLKETGPGLKRKKSIEKLERR